MKVTVENVARRAGVSRATAARILGGYAGPRSKAREGVLKAAEELGYFPNKLAKGLASKRSNKIGMILPDIENLYFAKLYRGAEATFRRKGYSFVLGISGEDEKKENEILRDLWSEQVEGIIIAPSNGLKELDKAPVPIVSVDRIPENPNYSWISTDNYESSYTAMEHLINRGYKDIVAIANLPHLSTVRERLAGIQAAGGQKKIKLSTLVTTSHQLENITSEVKEFLHVNNPSAAIVMDSIICTAVLIAAQDYDIQIGTELGLIAYDDEPWMSLVNPSITTIKQPVGQMGEISANILYSQLSSPKVVAPQKERLSSQLTPRHSTRTHNHSWVK